MKTSRRQFLKYAGISGLALTFGCRKKQKTDDLESKVSGKEEPQRTITPANQILRDFPEQITGAGEIAKYETAGAKYCLVHIKQMHPTEEEQTASELADKLKDEKATNVLLDMVKYRWEKTNECQREIYFILDSLRQTIGLEELRPESVTKEYGREAYQEFYKRILTRALAECYPTIEEMDEHMTEYQFAPGAHILLGMQEKLRILPGEKSSLNRQAHENRKNGTDNTATHEAREDYLLALGADPENPLIISPYGIRHNFLDNIKKWNEQHPDEKYSLIEVVPRSLMY